MGPAAWTWLAVAGSAVVFGIVSCSADDRKLSLGGSSGASAAGGADIAGAGGEAGQNAQPAPLPICDYGSGVAPGCETLVQNPGFSKDTFGWAPEDATVVMTWVASDAASNRKSGSISVVNSLFGAANGVASRGATQCLPTRAGKAYGFAADIFIPDGQGAGADGGSYSGSAGLSVLFFTSSHCDDFTLSSSTSVLLEDSGSWAHREGRAVAPDGAKSLLVRLVAFKNFREYNFEARFDNVLVKAE